MNGSQYVVLTWKTDVVLRYSCYVTRNVGSRPTVSVSCLRRVINSINYIVLADTSMRYATTTSGSVPQSPLERPLSFLENFIDDPGARSSSSNCTTMLGAVIGKAEYFKFLSTYYIMYKLLIVDDLIPTLMPPRAADQTRGIMIWNAHPSRCQVDLCAEYKHDTTNGTVRS